MIVDEDRTRTRTVLYKYADDKLIKIDEVESDKEIFLNTLYENLLIYSYIYNDPVSGQIISPMHTEISDSGFSKLYFIDEYKK